MAPSTGGEETDSVAYEEENVHAVYEQIASHFSSTRYKPWPIIERFLKDLPSGSIGLDVGCGNGKYLGVNRDVFIVGSDRSPALASIASQHPPHSVCVADCLALPHATGSFDFAVSIAVIHHLSTRERRIEAVRAVLETLKSPENGQKIGDEGGGRALLYVWALEQESSRRGWKAGGEQDVMVPWVMRQKGKEEKTFQRYYHLYAKGELGEDVVAAGGRVVEGGYEKDNWWVVAERVAKE